MAQALYSEKEHVLAQPCELLNHRTYPSRVEMRHTKPDYPVFPGVMLALALLIALPIVASAQTIERDPITVIIKMVDKSTAQWRFEPSRITVAQGDTVRFVQEDIVPHNVEITEAPKGSNIDNVLMGPFLLNQGQTYDLVITDDFALGTIKYVCTPHVSLGMKGEIEVVARGQVHATN